MIEESDLSPWVKEKSIDAFRIIAEAEAKIHGIAVEQVHFHEVGAMDSIIDIVGAMIGVEYFKPEKVRASSVNVGGGMINIDHGHYPVPAPATAEILKAIPVYSSGIQKELVTPTGAALLKVLVDEFGDLPEMKMERIGYGAGERELRQPNVLRIFQGEMHASETEADEIVVIETNIDDMNPQYYDFAFEKLFEAGALDVFIEPILMKKGRPGHKLTVLCRKEDFKAIQAVIFRHTTSIGVRYRIENRAKLQREIRTVDTPWGPIRVKLAWLGEKLMNQMPEYEDLKRIAIRHDLSLKVIEEKVKSILSDSESH
ncbi:MAG: nickel pincer cofactor biosynthesis protein LarC [Methanobacteriota archaeon]|nr:MAG: nickel pincer cofactor biosynthesis protein LarC [Euryarchaeota archaeon]